MPSTGYNWNKIIWLEILEISIQAYIFLWNIDGSRVTYVLLAMEIVEFTRIMGDKSEQFKICCIVYLHKLWYKFTCKK